MEEKELETHFIGFYRFTDTSTWQRSQVEKDKERLRLYLESVDYIDKNSIKIVEIGLPK